MAVAYDLPASDVSFPVAALVEAIASVGRQAPAELPPGQALRDTEVLLAQLEALHVVVLSRVADVDARGLHGLDGAPSTGTWVAQQRTSLDRGEVALARRLGALPGVEAELSSGGLSVEAARRVAAALSKLRRHVDRPDGLVDGQDGEAVVTAVVVDGVRQLVCEARAGLDEGSPVLVALRRELLSVAARPVSQLARLEAGFVVLARHVEQGLLSSCLNRLVDAVLPSELERRAGAAHDDRGFDLRRKADGSGWLITDGELDLECGELLDTVLRAELDVDPDNPVDTDAFRRLVDEGWSSTDALPACGGPRSLRQRRHDALRNGLRRYLDAGIAGLRDKVAPHLQVTVGVDALHDAPGALPATGRSGASVPAGLVRQWWCDSEVTRFVLSLGRRVLEVSHSRRTLTGPERRVKHLEAGGRCQGAGCTRGPGCRLVPHHPTPYAATGSTSVEDTVMLCEQTHHQLHTGGRPLRLKDGRLLGPEGWVDGPDG